MNDHIYLAHHGIKGMKWGIRRFRNPDGSLTDAGKKRYLRQEQRVERQLAKSDALLDRGDYVGARRARDKIRDKDALARVVDKYNNNLPLARSENEGWAPSIDYPGTIDTMHLRSTDSDVAKAAEKLKTEANEVVKKHEEDVKTADRILGGYTTDKDAINVGVRSLKNDFGSYKDVDDPELLDYMSREYAEYILADRYYSDPATKEIRDRSKAIDRMMDEGKTEARNLSEKYGDAQVRDIDGMKYSYASVVAVTLNEAFFDTLDLNVNDTYTECMWFGDRDYIGDLAKNIVDEFAK